MRDINRAWLAEGDFNSVVAREKVSNMDNFNDRRSNRFTDWIFSQGLVDMGYTEPCFTWKRGNDMETFKGAFLDRTLCTMH